MWYSIVNGLAEFLFYITGGVALLNTPWSVLYVAVLVVAIAIIIYVGAYLIDKKKSNLGIVSIPIGVFVFLVGIGAPITQAHMLIGDCVTHEYTTPNGNEFTKTECPVKRNYYEDEYFWKFGNSEFN